MLIRNRGPVSTIPPGNPYGSVAPPNVPSGPPNNIATVNSMGLKTAHMAPPSISQASTLTGPPFSTPNGHAPPSSSSTGHLASESNGVSTPGFQIAGTGPASVPTSGNLPGQPHIQGPLIGNAQHLYASQTPQLPPSSGMPIQSPGIMPPTGAPYGGIRPGSTSAHVPYQSTPLNNGPTLAGISGPPRPPIPGAFGGSAQIQQAQHTQRHPNQMTQGPSRPPMMGIPPMQQNYPGGTPSMPPPPGPASSPMAGVGGIRPPGLGPLPPSSTMGGYPPPSHGIGSSNTVSTVLIQTF